MPCVVSCVTCESAFPRKRERERERERDQDDTVVNLNVSQKYFNFSSVDNVPSFHHSFLPPASNLQVLTFLKALHLSQVHSNQV